MENLQRIVGELQQTVGRHDRELAAHVEQIKTLFTGQECLGEMTRAITVLVTKMESFEKGQISMLKRFDTLEAIPAKNWQTIVTALITGIISAIIGAIVATLK